MADFGHLTIMSCCAAYSFGKGSKEDCCQSFTSLGPNPWVAIRIMSDFVVKGIVNRLGIYIDSNPNNFLRSKKNYVQFRVNTDVMKPLKNKM